MDKAKKIAVALGLLTLPFFAGGWTQAQAQQQDERLITEMNKPTDFNVMQSKYYGNVLSSEEGHSDKYFSPYYIANSSISGVFHAVQAGLMGTDRITYEFQTNYGSGPEVRMKVLYFWGNNTILHGSEVVIDTFTVGSNVFSGTLWCDHGGIPSSSETSNKRWNCNFAAVSFQVKLSGEVKTERFLINWDDGNSDTFLSNKIYDGGALYNMYLDMLSPWGEW